MHSSGLPCRFGEGQHRCRSNFVPIAVPPMNNRVAREKLGLAALKVASIERDDHEVTTHGYHHVALNGWKPDVFNSARPRGWSKR